MNGFPNGLIAGLDGKSNVECYKEALKVSNLSCKDAWIMLGKLGGFQAHNESCFDKNKYSAEDCFKKVLELFDGKGKEAWLGLG